MANHLIIGLGGSGGAVIKALHSISHKVHTPEKISANVNIEYLYVDSYNTVLNDQSACNTLGAPILLSDSQKVPLKTMDSFRLDYLDQYPGIRSFITDSDKMLIRDAIPLLSMGLTSQQRRLGRILFANNISSNSTPTFLTQLKERVAKLVGKDSDDAVSFHICAGLAGAIGSASLIDVIAQIRKEFPTQRQNPYKYKVYLYLYVPEDVVKSSHWDAGFYQANGYATLLELNAMSIGEYNPVDISGKSYDNHGNIKRLLHSCTAFDMAFLYSDTQSNGHHLDINTELPIKVADFLFQKIFNPYSLLAKHIYRLEEFPGRCPEADNRGKAARSRSFLSFGVKRLSYPETEIVEYVTFRLASQMAIQMAGGRWVNGVGFVMTDKGIDNKMIENGLIKEEIKIKFLLSDSHLTLSKPITDDPSIRKWRSIESTWQFFTDLSSEKMQPKEEKKNRLTGLLISFEQHYNEGYRGMGVKKFYRENYKNIDTFADYIGQNAEKILFYEWLHGEKSFSEIGKYISMMIDVCSTRIGLFEKNIDRLENILTGSIADDIHACESEWYNIGILEEFFTKKSIKTLEKYRGLLCDRYIMLTQIEGYRYGISLLQRIGHYFNMLRENITLLKDLAIHLSRYYEDLAGARCVADVNTPGHPSTLIIFDPEEVRRISNLLIDDETELNSQALKIRESFAALLGEDNYGFIRLMHMIDVKLMENKLTAECDCIAWNMIYNHARSDYNNRIIHVNILERIKSMYADRAQQEKFIRDLIESAKPCLQWNATEMVTGTVLTPFRNMIHLSIPEYNDSTSFRKEFIDLFAKICSTCGYFFDEYDCLSVNPNRGELTVTTIVGTFPLRYVHNLAALRERYDDLTTGQKGEYHRMMLHTESFDTPLPPLFES